MEDFDIKYWNAQFNYHKADHSHIFKIQSNITLKFADSDIKVSKSKFIHFYIMTKLYHLNDDNFLK